MIVDADYTYLKIMPLFPKRGFQPRNERKKRKERKGRKERKNRKLQPIGIELFLLNSSF